MKKRGIIVSIVLILGIASIGICYFVKGDWKDVMSTYGELNIMETDDIGSISENKSSSSFTVTDSSEFYLSGNINVNKGSASCTITWDGVNIYEMNFDEGNYPINTEVFKDNNGEIIIEIKASDDVDGDYNIVMHTRESLLEHFIRRLKENF